MFTTILLNICNILEDFCHFLSIIFKLNYVNNRIISSFTKILSLFNLSCILGKDANPQERKAAMKTAEHFLEQMNYPINTQVCVEIS